MCGLVGSLPIVTAMLALSAEPPPVGVKVKARVQLDLGDAEEVQVPPVTLKSLPFVPLKPSLNGSENPDRLVTVTFSVFDLPVSVPYASVTGTTVAGIVGPVLSATVYGLSGSGLSAIDRVADSVPRTPGVNVTVIVHDLLAASVVVQVPPVIEKSAGFAPLKDSLRVIA